MRILIVSPFARDAARGNSVAASRLARGLAARGHAAALVDAVAGSAGPEALARALAAAGPADVALILHAAHGAAAAGILRRAGTPYVVSLRGTDANELLADPARGPAILAALAGAARIAVFHEAMRGQLGAHAPGLLARARVVSNGIDVPVSQVDYRATLRLPAGAFVFLSLAGLREVKRPLFPVEALAALAAERPNLRFVRAGPAIEVDVARAMRDAARASSWVVDAGEIPRDTVDSFLRMGDVFVSASRSEGMPHAVREAMLCGKALLLSDIPGHRAMAEPGREALFFDNDHAFRAEARRLLADAPLRQRLGAAARARVESELASHDETGEYQQLLKEAYEA